MRNGWRKKSRANLLRFCPVIPSPLAKASSKFRVIRRYLPMQSADKENTEDSLGLPALRLDIHAILHLLLEKAWLIATCVVTVALLGCAYIMRSPNIYAAQTVIQVEQSEQRVVKIQGLQEQDLRTAELLKTIEQNLGSPTILLRVAKSLKLAENPHFLPARKASYTDNELIDALAGHVSVKLRRGTR